MFATERGKCCARLALVIAHEYSGGFDFGRYLELSHPDNSAMLWQAVDSVYADFEALDDDNELVMSALKADVHDSLALLVDAVRWELERDGSIPSGAEDLQRCLVEYVESKASPEVVEAVVSATIAA